MHCATFAGVRRTGHSSHIYDARAMDRIVVRACTRLRAPAAYVAVLERSVVLLAEHGLRREFFRVEPWEMLARRVAAASGPLAVSDTRLDGTLAPMRSVRAFIGTPFASGQGALVVWDGRVRDIEPAALLYMQELGAELDALRVGKIAS